MFTPVGPNWQKDPAAALKLRVSTKLKESPETSISVYDPPIKTVPIREDGNCLFRTISYFITGGQQEHLHSRKTVVEFMNKHNESFSNTANCPNYATSSDMINPGEWGTEVEIYAFATLLSAPVYVYGPSGRDNVSNTIYKWLKYEPLKDVNSHLNLLPLTENIYIRNMGSHFVPVIFYVNCVDRLNEWQCQYPHSGPTSLNAIRIGGYGVSQIHLKT